MVRRFGGGRWIGAANSICAARYADVCGAMVVDVSYGPRSLTTFLYVVRLLPGR